MTTRMVSSKPPSKSGQFIERWDGVGAISDEDLLGDLVTSPYPGLCSFSAKLNPYFFGRESQKQELKSFFARQDDDGSGRRITFVIGGSGSGKSSLVRAGLIAELPTTTLSSVNGAWYVAEFRPGLDPVKALVSSLRDVVARFANTDNSITTSLKHIDGIDEQGRRAIAIRELLRFVDKTLYDLDARTSGERSGPPRLLLHIDQFEEIFRPGCAASARNAVMQFLREVDEVRPERLFVVGTVRSEELHKFSEFYGIAGIINDSMYLIDLVDRGEVEEVIVNPAWRLAKLWDLPLQQLKEEPNAPYSKDAVGMIAREYEAAGEQAPHTADRLPLLQHFLPLLWKEAVTKWIERRNVDADAIFRIDADNIARVPGWLEPQPPPSGSKQASRAAGPLGRCLDAAGDQVFRQAVLKMQETVIPWVESQDVNVASSRNQGSNSDIDILLQSNEARLLQAALTSMAQLDDQGQAVRRVVTLERMIQDSGAAARVDGKTDDNARIRTALKDALEIFRRASLIEHLKTDHLSVTGELFSVTHEALIRCWARLHNWLEEKRSVERTLKELTDIESGNSAPRSRILDWLFWRNGQRAAALIPPERVGQLSTIFGSLAVYSKEWADSIIAKSLAPAHEGLSTEGAGATASYMQGTPAWRSERIAALWQKARRFHRWGIFQQGLIVALGTAALLMLVILVGAWKISSRDNRLAQIALATNEGLAFDSRQNRNAIQDKALSAIIDATLSESKDWLTTGSQTLMIYGIASQLDSGIRSAVGNDVVVSLDDIRTSGVGNDLFADCSSVGAEPNTHGEQQAQSQYEGLVCVSPDKRWSLRWPAIGAANVLPRIEYNLNSPPQVRSIRSEESAVRYFSVSGDPKFAEFLQTFKAKVAVKFIDDTDDSIVRFVLPPFPDSAGNGRITLWTTTGFQNATEVSNAPWDKMPHISLEKSEHCEPLKKTDPQEQSEILECKVNVSSDLNLDEQEIGRIAPSGDLVDSDPGKHFVLSYQKPDAIKSNCPKDTSGCYTQIEIRYGDKLGQQQQKTNRVFISHMGARILKAGVISGYVWLEDANGSTWRYVVGENRAKAVLEARTRNLKWLSPEAPDGIRYRPLNACSRVEECRRAIETETEHWPGLPKPEQR